VKTRGLFIAAVALLLLGLPATASAGQQLTARERAQINATMDSFVNHVVKRQNIDAGYDSVTPEFRLGMSRKEWDKGSLPGFPYPAAGKTFHGWIVTYRNGNELGIEIVLQPQKGSGVGAGSFPMTLKRIHGRWLVDSMVPGAFFAPEGKKARVVGTNDFLAQGNSGGGGDGGGVGTQRIPADYAYVPFAIFGLIAVILVGAALIGGFRWRKARDGLPPLPERMRTRT
jgi:hypothetical protein